MKYVRIRCSGTKWCRGLQGQLGTTGLRVSLILSIDTGKEWHVLVIDGVGRKSRGATLNYCPFCGARVNKAYYEHCMEPEPRTPAQKPRGQRKAAR